MHGNKVLRKICSSKKTDVHLQFMLLFSLDKGTKVCKQHFEGGTSWKTNNKMSVSMVVA
jgi:hypothetical protein